MQSFRRLFYISHQRDVSGIAKDFISSNFSISRRANSTVHNPLAVGTGSTSHNVYSFPTCYIHLAKRCHEFKCSSNLMTHIRGALLMKTPGRKIFVGTLMGFTLASSALNSSKNIAYAMSGSMESNLSEEDPFDFTKQDVNSWWAMIKKFQLPAVLFLTVVVGLANPLILSFNVALLLFCTKPSPLSIYIFIEKLRQQSMREKPSLSKTRLFYASKMEIKDLKLFCYAKVELKDVKMSLIGALGSWWIIHSSST